MSIYYCHLGNTPELSFYELQLVNLGQEVSLVLPTIARLELADDAAAQQLMNVSGGLVKIYKELEVLTDDKETTITDAVVSHLQAAGTDKVTFGISTFNISAEIIDIANVKLALKQLHIPSRYVDSDPPYGVAAAILLKKKTRELMIIKTNDTVLVTETVAVQDINDWTKRDRMKPYADRKKGMLPPKVARMLVNIGVGLVTDEKEKSALTLYDPFMGSGTVLMEAAMRGVHARGSDLDMQSVNGVRQNLEWLNTEYEVSATSDLSRRDAAQRFTAAKRDVDLIVTEPFLGKPTPHEKELPNMFKGLLRMYLGAFKNWTSILKPNAPVVIIFPLVMTTHRTFSLHDLIDKLEDLGYTNVSQPIVYSRPQAIVQREIHFFRFKGK